MIRHLLSVFNHISAAAQTAAFFLFVSVLLLFPTGIKLSAQGGFFDPADSLRKDRLFWVAGTGLAAYASVSWGLYHAWYKPFLVSKPRSFNDWGEWRHMDKFGHIYSGYIQCGLIHHTARWTGMSKNQALWAGVAGSLITQSSIEVWDGFSQGWGFSWADMAANFLGTGLYFGQEWWFGQQKVFLKFSAISDPDPNDPVIRERILSLFGNNPAQKLLKDYNHQTYWLSFHPGIWKPRWLLLSLGVGAQGLYGGFANEWKTDMGVLVRPDPLLYPRISQYYLSADLDLTKIPVKNQFLRSLFRVLNIVKMPAPALEFTSQGRVHARWLR